ncbi:MAG: hypothetical protein ACRYGP_30710 [Janthinobacterium lividum]
MLLIKYYPLRPTNFVLSQYLWTMELGNFRRSVLSTLAGLAWNHDPARFLPVVDLMSLIEMAGLALALAWGAVRLAGRPVPRLALLLVLCSGAASHLVATRGSQDGFAALALIGFAAALDRRLALAAALLGALAVSIHEASIAYVASLCGLHLLLTGVGTRESWRETARRIGYPQMRPVLAGGAAAIAILVGVMTGSHLSPGVVDEVCRTHAWIASVGSLDALRSLQSETPAQDWAGSCGLQFKAFDSTLGFFLRSVPVGALFAPVTLLAVLLAIRARLPGWQRFGIAASLLLPTLLPLIATDVTRFWSYTNLTALYGIVLLQPHLQGFGRVSVRGLFGGVLALWALVAIGVDQWPTGWPQPPSALPSAIAQRLPTFRDVLCSASQQGACARPMTNFH